MSTSGNKDLIANVSNVFGAKLASQIVPFKVDLESIIGEGTVEGFISKPEWGIGRSSADRQYFYVNGRPCSLPRVRKYTHIYFYMLTSFVAIQGFKRNISYIYLKPIPCYYCQFEDAN